MLLIQSSLFALVSIGRQFGGGQNMIRHFPSPLFLVRAARAGGWRK